MKKVDDYILYLSGILNKENLYENENKNEKIDLTKSLDDIKTLRNDVVRLKNKPDFESLSRILKRIENIFGRSKTKSTIRYADFKDIIDMIVDHIIPNLPKENRMKALERLSSLRLEVSCEEYLQTRRIKNKVNHDDSNKDKASNNNKPNIKNKPDNKNKPNIKN